jgi:hypothetical protein
MEYNVIGTINKPTGVMLTDGEGFEYPELAPIEGYHVNTTQEVVEWEQYCVTPNTPMRVYAGVKTYFYSFPDKEAFESVTGHEDL